MDCEILQQIQRYLDPKLWATEADDIALDAIKSVGNDGHFFGISTPKTAIQQPSTNPS